MMIRKDLFLFRFGQCPMNIFSGIRKREEIEPIIRMKEMKREKKTNNVFDILFFQIDIRTSKLMITVIK